MAGSASPSNRANPSGILSALIDSLPRPSQYGSVLKKKPRRTGGYRGFRVLFGERWRGNCQVNRAALLTPVRSHRFNLEGWPASLAFIACSAKMVIWGQSIPFAGFQLASGYMSGNPSTLAPMVDFDKALPAPLASILSHITGLASSKWIALIGTKINAKRFLT